MSKESPTESRPWPKLWEHLWTFCLLSSRDTTRKEKPPRRKIIPDGNTCVAALSSVKASAKAEWRSKEVYNMWGSSYKSFFPVLIPLGSWLLMDMGGAAGDGSPNDRVVSVVFVTSNLAWQTFRPIFI